MTTVVYDGRYLVADTRVTSNTPQLEGICCPHCNTELDRTGYRERNKITIPQKALYLCGYKVLCFATIGRIDFTDLIKNILLRQHDVEEDLRMLLNQCGALNVPVGSAKVLVITDGGPIILDIRTGLKKVTKDKLPLCLGSGADSAKTAIVLGTKISHVIGVVSKINRSTGKNFTYVDTHAEYPSVIRARVK